MTTLRRLWLPAALLALAVGSAGCNLLQVPFFLFGPEPSVPAQFVRLADEKDKDREVKVVILVDGGLETRSEFIGVERELATRLGRQLHELCEYNKEKVAIVPAAKVERFKQDHPGWHTMDKADIGKHFDADYVIHLEINSLTLYKKGSGNSLFRGLADISVTVVDVKSPEDGRGDSTAFRCEYPSEAKGGIDVSDTNPLQFRQMFLTYLAKKLAWQFTSHPTAAEHECE